MRHKVKKVKLGKRDKAQTKLLLGNLATSLVLHKKIKTTQAKAKALQPLMERLIVKAKNTDKTHAIREINKILQSELSSKKLIEEIVKKYENKQSGFTRITNVGHRSGDSAPIVQIELIY
jgi:large subunit ribosomal protein L17